MTSLLVVGVLAWATQVFAQSAMDSAGVDIAPVKKERAGENDSQITIYGTMNVTAEVVSARGGTPQQGQTGASMGRVSSNSSLLGFRGNEKFGSSQLQWQIEGGLNVDTGTGTLNNRDTFVGWVDPSFGTVKVGFLTAPMRMMGGRLNFVPGSTTIANNIGLMTTLGGVQTDLNSRLQKAMVYSTPAMFGGLTANATVSPPAHYGDGPAYYTYGGSLVWQKADTYLGYAFESRRNRNLTGVTAQKIVADSQSNDYEHRVAFRYKFPTATTLGLGWDHLGSAGLFGTGAKVDGGQVKRDAYSMSVKQEVGNQEFIMHYAYAGSLDCLGGAVTYAKGTYAGCAPSATGETGAQQLALVYYNWLSKRTMLQAYFSKILNQSQGRYDWDTNPYQSDPRQRTPGANPSGIGMGIRTTF
jgi:hypothetical protein